ncbi:MAG: CapA family protein, partial [Coriobacteriia bacterium]|nr:CapA family protein [Coriobacteriia bacterium]
MDERYENDYENTANQWEETTEGGRVTYRERNPREAANNARPTPRRRTVEYSDEAAERPRRYEPAGTREYRTSSRPGRERPTRSRTAGSRSVAPAGGAAEGVMAFAQPILLAAVALLAVISILTGIVSCATGGGQQGEAVNTPAALNTEAAANVAAAEKTTDANGIVHGTTADGTNFTIVYADGENATPAVAAGAAATTTAGTEATESTESTEATAESNSTDAAAAESESTSEGTAESMTVSTAGASTAAEEQPAEGAENADAAAADTTGATQKVSFAAVGDQVASDYALELADGYAGQAEDGKYDFKPFYQEVKPFLNQFNLRFINQETPLIGGQENYEVSGYPNFISPEACADAIVDTNFNMVAFDSNHSYDAGTEGIEYSQKVWEKYPQIVLAGSYADQAARETVHMIESNGIRFAFLAYSYGDNTYTDVTKEPNNYYAVPFVKDDAAADIARAKQVADCIIVYMHWGDEYTAELNNDQKDWAQFLADQDVDLVIGSHAHNIQPVQYFTGASGNKIPVVFGLGDFVSGWTITDTILSGIFTCDFVPQENGRVSVENPKWHPTIEWSDGSGQTYVRMLENMTVDEINANTRTEDVPNSFAHLYNTTNSVISQIPVEWGSDADDKATKAASGDSESSSSSGSSASASGHVDEDEDGYDDNTDEWIGFGDDDDADASDSDADSDSDSDSDNAEATGPVDEDGDGYDDNTDEW